MIKIKFNDSERFYPVSFANAGNVVTLTGENIPLDESGFTTYRARDTKYLGDFSAYKTIYRKMEGAVQFSNDGSTYVEPATDQMEDIGGGNND